MQNKKSCLPKHLAVFISSIIKSVHDNGWGMFTTYLKYKLEDMGKQLLKIDKFFASSQICNVCGYKKSRYKKLSIGQWECLNCKSHHNRDVISKCITNTEPWDTRE